MKKNTITIKDIAQSLGISKATVSLCINGNPVVAEKTRIKVMKKIEELGYVYNRRAASLSTGETRTVGFSFHDITSQYFAKVFTGIEHVLNEHDRMPFLCNSRESIERQQQFINAMVEQNADGLVLCPAEGTDVNSINSIFAYKLPTVLITREVPDLALDFIGNDEHLTMHIAAEHLLKLGHRKIAFLGGNHTTSVAINRRNGFLDAMREYNIENPEQWLFNCDNDTASGEAKTLQLFEDNNPPTAIIAFSDAIGLGVICALQILKLDVGKDVSVVACDNIEESSRAYAQLTTVHIQKNQIGRLAAQTLLKRIADPTLPIQRIILSPELIIRKSSGPVNS